MSTVRQLVMGGANAAARRLANTRTMATATSQATRAGNAQVLYAMTDALRYAHKPDDRGLFTSGPSTPEQALGLLRTLHTSAGQDMGLLVPKQLRFHFATQMREPDAKHTKPNRNFDGVNGDIMTSLRKARDTATDTEVPDEAATKVILAAMKRACDAIRKQNNVENLRARRAGVPPSQQESAGHTP